MIRMIRRLFAVLFVVVGFAVIVGAGFALFWSDELQRIYVPSLPSIERHSGGDSKGREAQDGTPIGLIEIPRLGLSSVVLEGDDTAALLLGVGHLSDTPLPWHGGNTVFAAHRDTFFRPLAQIRKNDVIKFSTADASFDYVVTELRVVEPTAVEVLEPTSAATLTLITCFPFDYIGPAPQRFIVRAERRSRTPLEPEA
ncbi:MAG TPA: class D sortase [Vicinamibacterales bacterium]|nr:class D sortase [Vicinamibacterales bacterium]